MSDVLLMVLIVVVGLVALFIISQWRVKRATQQVLRIFGEYSAIGIKHAKTIDELGLRPRGRLEGVLRGRDYRPSALDALINAEIVQMTEDGKLYISEDKLIESGLGRYAGYS